MDAFLGVDGRRGGWALALVRGGPGGAELVRWGVADRLGPVLAQAREDGVRAVGIDVPIGLPAGAWRPADLLAKRRLGAASARVFLVPPRVVLAAPDYATARVRCREVMGGKGLSAQTWGLRDPVLAVDELLREPGWARDHLVETHPELSLADLAGRVLPSKKGPDGRAARLDALTGWLDLDAGAVPAGDDHLDAAACAWSAARWSGGVAGVLGGEPDERGLPQRIVT